MERERDGGRRGEGGRERARVCVRARARVSAEESKRQCARERARERATERARERASERVCVSEGGRDLVELEGGHVGDVARYRCLLVLVHVHLEKLTLIHTGHLGNLGRDRFAWPAPGCGEVHTYQLPAAPGFRGMRLS
jgi:hypothetical protein